MQDEPRVVDHTPVVEAARAEAGRYGAQMVFMTIGQLWRLIHQAPTMTSTERKEFAAPIKAR